MREFGKVGPTFWTRGTGKALRGHPEAQIVALYLMSAPTSNMIGLYYLPVEVIAHDTGLPLEGASKGLRRAFEGGFCTYDEASEMVFVHTMAPRQLGLDDGEALSPKDNRVKAIVKLMRECGCTVLLDAFHSLYRDRLCLPSPWWEAPLKGLARGSEAPSKPGDGDGDGDGEREGECERGQAATPTEPAPAPKPDPLPVAVATGPALDRSNSVETPEAKPKRKGRLPDSWAYTAQHRDKAYELGLDVDAEADAFRDYHQAHGTTMAKWDMAFHTWLRNAVKFGPAPGKTPKPDYLEIPDDAGPAMSLAEALQFCPPEHRAPIQEFLGGVR